MARKDVLTKDQVAKEWLQYFKELQAADEAKILKLKWFAMRCSSCSIGNVLEISGGDRCVRTLSVG